jgi:hypothetical protein
MSHKSPTSSRALYLIDLSERMQRMEAGGERMDPLAYRLFARRLRQALVGCSPAELPAAVKQPLALREALADRHFAERKLPLLAACGLDRRRRTATPGD